MHFLFFFFCKNNFFLIDNVNHQIKKDIFIKNNFLFQKKNMRNIIFTNLALFEYFLSISVF